MDMKDIAPKFTIDKDKNEVIKTRTISPPMFKSSETQSQII